MVESVIESVVEAVVEAVVEPLVIKLEEPVIVKLSDKKDDEPAQVNVCIFTKYNFLEDNICKHFLGLFSLFDSLTLRL